MHKKYLHILLIVSVFAASLGTSFYLHKHVLPNGEVVIHSHFHSDTADEPNSPGHSHSGEEIKEIFLFSSLIMLIILSALLYLFLLKNISLYRQIDLNIYISRHTLNLFNLRAPPLV